MKLALSKENVKRMRETTDKPYPQRGMMELGREQRRVDL
jgi:hypothetical protein